MNANPKPSALVSVVIRIVAGSTEDLGRLPRPGQRRWWVQRTDRNTGENPWYDIGHHPGNEPATFAVELVAGGRYVVGTGADTRVRFVAPQNPCTLSVDPGNGSANVVPSTPPLTVVEGGGDKTPPRPTFHVKAAPMGSEARGVTYHDPNEAFAALRRMVEGGEVHHSDVTEGRVAVTRGAWPVASYPPAPPPTPVATGGSIGGWEVDGDGLGYHHASGAAVRRGPSDRERWVCTDGLGYPGLGEAQSHALDLEIARDRAFTRAQVSTVQPLAAALPTPTIPPAPERTEGPSFTFTSGEHEFNADSAERIKADDAYLRTFGLVMPPPVVQLGGVVNSTGRANLAASHAEWRAEPLTVDALTTIGTAIRNEDRRDVPTRLGTARMLPDGRLVTGTVEPGGVAYSGASGNVGLVHLEESALRQLVALYPRTLPRAGEVMSVLPPAVRAHVWNDGAGRERDTDTVVVRTRNGEHGRQAFAAVSEGYTACDADVVADWVGRALRNVDGGSEARGAAEYNPETTGLRIDAIWHADRVANFAAGDVFKFGVRITSNDAGNGAIRVGLVAYRNLCYNLIITSQTHANVARVIHRGEQRDMVRRLVAGINHAASAAAPFLTRWGYLRQHNVAALVESPSEDTTLNLRAIFAEIAGNPDPELPQIKRGALPEGVSFAGVDRDVAVETLLRSWRNEPGDTLADVVNAVTRLHAAKVPVPVLRSAEQWAGDAVEQWGRVALA